MYVFNMIFNINSRKLMLNFREVYLFANPNGSGAERDAPAEAFVSSGDGSAIAESDILTVNMMEHQRWQIVRARIG